MLQDALPVVKVPTCDNDDIITHKGTWCMCECYIYTEKRNASHFWSSLWFERDRHRDSFSGVVGVYHVAFSLVDRLFYFIVECV